jgi:hypothetical protein
MECVLARKKGADVGAGVHMAWAMFRHPAALASEHVLPSRTQVSSQGGKADTCEVLERMRGRSGGGELKTISTDTQK